MYNSGRVSFHPRVHDSLDATIKISQFIQEQHNYDELLDLHDLTHSSQCSSPESPYESEYEPSNLATSSKDFDIISEHTSRTTTVIDEEQLTGEEALNNYYEKVHTFRRINEKREVLGKEMKSPLLEYLTKVD